MELTPRYGGTALIDIGDADWSIIDVVIDHRRRLADRLAAMAPSDASGPTRCAEWDVRELVQHMESTTAFWQYSVVSALAGRPSELLAGFDPVRTPAALVDAKAAESWAEALDRFLRSNDAFCATVSGLGAGDLIAIGESPAGHTSVSSVLHHSLWDLWVHERDIDEPLGHRAEMQLDEVRAVLAYAAGVGAALDISNGADRRGTLGVSATLDSVDSMLESTAHIDDGVRIDAGLRSPDYVLRGEAVELIDAFSVRRSSGPAVPSEFRWMLGDLASVFEVERTS